MGFFLKKVRIVFMGTPQFAVPVLEKLIDIVEVVLVVTQPDKPVGRKHILTNSPIKEVALKHHIPVFQPVDIRKSFQPIVASEPDLIITCAYGQIISKEVLNLPSLGCINVHASLLPKYRGGAPIHRALMNGEEKTGVTIMYMDEKMDTGDIICQREYQIKKDDNVGTLHEVLSHLGADLLMEVLPSILDKTNDRICQKDAEATYAYTIKREEERIDFHQNGEKIINQIRGLNPWPGANMLVNQEEYKVLEAKFVKKNDSVPGKVTVLKDTIGIDALDGTIYLMKIKPFGKRIMEVKDFLNGAKEKDVLNWEIR